jgi:hypothetical protein
VNAAIYRLTQILRVLPHEARRHAVRHVHAQPNHRDSGQQSTPPPTFWDRHARNLLGVSVLVAALIVLIWPNALLSLAVAALVPGLTLLVVLVAFLAWRGQPPR